MKFIAAFMACSLGAAGIARPADVVPVPFAHSDPAPAELTSLQVTNLPLAEADYEAFWTAPDRLDRLRIMAHAGHAESANRLARHYSMQRTFGEPCAPELEWWKKAAELGSPFAVGSHGYTLDNMRCPEGTPHESLELYERAIALGVPRLAMEVINLSGDDPERFYLYTRINEFDSAWVLGDSTVQKNVKVAGRRLDRATRAAIDLKADALLARIRDIQMKWRAPPPAVALGVSRNAADWSASLVAYDETRECAINHLGNCRGVRRLAFIETQNSSPEFQHCRFTLTHREFATHKLSQLVRETLLAPATGRRLRLGFFGEVAAGDFLAECQAVKGLAADVAAGRCGMRATNMPAASALRAAVGEQAAKLASMRVALWLNTREGTPTIVENETGSGLPTLDRWLVEQVRKAQFRGECTQGVLSFAPGAAP